MTFRIESARAESAALGGPSAAFGSGMASTPRESPVIPLTVRMPVS